MKILAWNPRSGEMKLRIESEDDLWVLHLVLAPGDVVVARTTRDVKSDTGEKRRIPMTLAVRVERTEFQPFTTRLRVHGVVIEGPERFGVKGSHHTLNIDIGSELTIVKEKWPHHALDRIERACKKGLTAVVAAVDYDECAVALIRDQGLLFVYDKSLGLPGKGDPNRENELRRAIAEACKAISDAAKRAAVKAVVVVGPGPLKEKVAEKLKESGLNVHVDTASSGGRAGVYEALRRGLVQKLLSDLSAIEAEEILEEFDRRLAKNPAMVAYGLDAVEKAASLGAVDKLLVLDEVLHSYDEEKRRRIDDLLREVERRRGRIVIVSKEAPAGMRLHVLGGVLALLRFPASYDEVSGH